MTTGHGPQATREVPREPCVDCTHDYCRCVAASRMAEDDAQHSEWVAEQREWEETELPDEDCHV